MSEERDALLRAAIEKWGADAQCRQATEELGELIVAVCHWQRSRASAARVVEEIADVTIMLEQLRLIVGARQYEVDRVVAQKLDRLNDRVKDLPPC